MIADVLASKRPALSAEVIAEKERSVRRLRERPGWTGFQAFPRNRISENKDGWPVLFRSLMRFETGGEFVQHTL